VTSSLTQLQLEGAAVDTANSRFSGGLVCLSALTGLQDLHVEGFWAGICNTPQGNEKEQQRTASIAAALAQLTQLTE
jgi:hypothetical protein